MTTTFQLGFYYNQRNTWKKRGGGVTSWIKEYVNRGKKGVYVSVKGEKPWEEQECYDFLV